ncbi:hypothetical protein WBG06_24680 [Nocardioides sp. CCNWLW239]|uniref:hypothetical protein n=1 Tax=Nocardioides sp. CCNWLW239 TaxID=3128902 RepID=UPI0030181509
MARDAAGGPNDGHEPDDRIKLTPEQKANLRRAMSNLSTTKVTFPESMFRNIAASLRPVIDAHTLWQKQLSKNLSENIDFSGIARSLEVVKQVSTTFAAQQAALFKDLGPALEAMRAGFYPPNLRGIEGLKFQDVDTVVMTDGIPLYGVPRTSTAEALIRADSASRRREIVGRRWKSISADCREALLGCSSNAVAPYLPFATAAVDALEAGHFAAAQALAGSLIDTIVTAYFGSDRHKYTPNKKNTTADAYRKLTIRRYIAFAPMWQTYQQFFVTNGDKVPTQFSRHATVHAVGARQYSRRNAVQALMVVCSLIYRFDEEAIALESSV